MYQFKFNNYHLETETITYDSELIAPACGLKLQPLQNPYSRIRVGISCITLIFEPACGEKKEFTRILFGNYTIGYMRFKPCILNDTENIVIFNCASNKKEEEELNFFIEKKVKRYAKRNDDINNIISIYKCSKFDAMIALGI